MEGMIHLTDEYGFNYEVVSQYRSGYCILFHVGASPCPWVIREPDGKMLRFKTENELWQYALKNKLFRKKGTKHGNH